jgi:hypothetical protein
LHERVRVPQLPQLSLCGVQHAPQLHESLQVRRPLPSQVMPAPGAHSP